MKFQNQTFWYFRGVESHFKGRFPAAVCDENDREPLGKLVGAYPDEVALTNALSVNLHLLLVRFYRPTETSYKIVIEKGAFPSDTVTIVI